MFLDKFLKRPLLFFVFMFAALPLWANAGLPMLFMVYPGFLTALIPVVLIEFFCLKGSFKDCSLKKLFCGVLGGNLISTLLGVPLTWLAAVAVQMALGGGRAYGLNGLGHKLYAAVVQASWLIPYEEAFFWLVPSAFTVLMLYFFLSSWLIEYGFMYLLFHKSYDKALICKNVFKANVVSYIFLYIFVLIYWLAAGFLN